MGIAAAQTQRRKSPTHRASEASRPPFSRRPSAQTSLQRSNRRRQPIRSLRSFGFPAISDWNRPQTAHRSNRRPRIPYEVRERRDSCRQRPKIGVRHKLCDCPGKCQLLDQVFAATISQAGFSVKTPISSNPQTTISKGADEFAGKCPIRNGDR